MGIVRSGKISIPHWCLLSIDEKLLVKFMNVGWRNLELGVFGGTNSSGRVSFGIDMSCGTCPFLPSMPFCSLEAVELVMNKAVQPIHHKISGFVLLHVSSEN